MFASPLTHLDVNAPVRRKVVSLAEAGNFACDFKAHEDSRWLFGKFAGIGVRFSVQYCRRQLGDRDFPNTFTWHLPMSFVQKLQSGQRLKALFGLGNGTFKPFYAYSDDVASIACKKKSFGAVNIQAELLGVFWLTYFNAAYVSFLGNDKFNGISNLEYDSEGGVTIILGDGPESVTNQVREEAVAALGKESFVNPSDILGKRPGEFALTFQQLLARR